MLAGDASDCDCLVGLAVASGDFLGSVRDGHCLKQHRPCQVTNDRNHEQFSAARVLLTRREEDCF